MAFTKEQAAFYLAGMIDGEGTVGCYKKAGGGHACRVSISNTDLDIIAAIKECCVVLEFPYSLYGPYKYGTWKDKYAVRINGGITTYKRISAEIPIQCKSKAKNLEKILASRKWLPLPDRETLRKRYHDDKKSLAEIAQEMKCAPMTVYNWLRRHGIERRSLSLAGKIDWERRGFRRR